MKYLTDLWNQLQNNNTRANRLASTVHPGDSIDYMKKVLEQLGRIHEDVKSKQIDFAALEQEYLARLKEAEFQMYKDFVKGGGTK